MTRHASVVSILLGSIVLAQSVCAANVQSKPDRQLLWGDTHLHSSYSMDAYLFQNRTADPDTAYRYAKGYPVIHPYHRARVQIGTPLDFLVISDHAELLGVIKSLSDGDPLVAQTSVGQRFMRMMSDGVEHEVFNEIAAASASSGYRGTPVEELNSPEIRGAMWQQITAAAERHNEPGHFSTLLGWEWSSFPDGANLHRVVITPAGADKGNQLVPFSAIDSTRPEDLWQWLDETSERLDIDFIAIPHNSNISRGQMFGDTDSEGRPQTGQYIRTRMHWEPVVEITQIKGDSETHPQLSPNDEFADFETFNTLLDTRPGVDKNATFDQGSYVRPALLQGMAMGKQRGENPYQFGLIGSTDSHTGLASAEETNFHGKVALDSTPESKDSLATENFDISGWDMSAAGLAAVWAEENTRESIFAAFRRREIYATTGPRIRLRFFGGWDYVPDHAQAADLAAIGYAKGVAMGGELENASAGSQPRFLIHAMKDPAGANLDRIQVIKGYVDEAGNTKEKIYNVALSDGRLPGRDGKIEPVGSTVDISSGRYTNDRGATELAVVWKDPEFSSDQYAFYYARVLEIPTPRHTLLDEIALQQEKYSVDTLQERAYSSPIWYTPGPPGH